MWAIYAFLPSMWIPAGVGAFYALRRSHPGGMLAAVQFALLASVSMMLGLMRWPTMHWRLATLYSTADAGQRAILDALFDGFNTYLGNYIGEFSWGNSDWGDLTRRQVFFDGEPNAERLSRSSDY